MRKRIAFALLLSIPALSPELGGQEAPQLRVDPQPARYESHHSIRVGEETVEYDAIVGSVILRDEDEEATAELFYTAYFRTDLETRSPRPIMFSYNGGPGSASFWLHMGIMGPRRVVTPVVGHQAPPPHTLEDNQFTLLDRTDIVMIDPVGTGFSRPVGDTPGSDFWGIDEDAASLTQFIRRFLSEYQRWNSPRYLLGESYGTTRSAVLSRHLQRANMDLNGIVLVSAVLDFRTIQFAPGDDLPYVVNLPAYAVVSAYLDALPGSPPENHDAFMKEVEEWALTEYATALLRGSTLDEETRTRIIDRMHRYTGLSREFIDRADLRVSAPEFEKELLRSQGLVVGRLDARFTGPSGDLLESTPDHDPQSTAISSAYTSAFNTYLRQELGYDGDREYTPSGATRNWNWQRVEGEGFIRGAGTPNVGPDLADAIRFNPNLEVLLVNGIYDLATPYFAAVWTMDHLGLPDHLRDNIQRADFKAGHMMYVEQTLLPQWKEALDAFIERTSGR